MPRDSVFQTFKLAAILCIVCSVVVSAAAVSLRSVQEANKVLERQKNILAAGGLLPDDATPAKVNDVFQRIERRLVNLDTGKYADPSEINPDEYNERQAASNPKLSEPIPAEKDLAGIKRREKYAFVYLVKSADGDGIEQIVLPVRGKGLWSTMYGFLSLDADLKTIRGLTFYEQGETPGLGGEVDNPKWKQQWDGKVAFDSEGNVQIEVIKGSVDDSTPGADHKIDGLAGATITSRGVENLIHYWLGPDAFGPYLKSLDAHDSLADQGANHG